MLLANVGRAQELEEAEELTAAQLVTDPNESFEATPLRPQLVQHDRMTPVVAGVTASVLGIGSLVSSWAVYIGRQNYRQRPWSRVDARVMDSWETQGAWAFWLGAGSATFLITAEYLLLPEERGVPTLAWLAGGAGLLTAALGVAYSVGGAHCGPQPSESGASIVRECLSGTSDALFGPLLLWAASPLLNVPITYLLRSLFAGAPEPLSFTPTSISVRATF
jgi:hypothetical protein